MFYALSKVLDVFLCPYTWGVLLLAAATPWSRRAGKRFRRRRAYGVAGLIVLVVGGLGPLPHAIGWQLEAATKQSYQPDVRYDAVVLLGGIVDEEATAEHGSAAYTDTVERLIETYTLLRANKAGSVIVTAAASDEFPEQSEAKVIARQLTEWGIAPERILLETKARNTRENALYAQAIARAHGFERVVIVTSAYHMTRALECFHEVGMPVDTLIVDYRAHAKTGRRAADWIPRIDGLSDTSSVTRELFGILIYRLRGYAKR